MSQRPAIWFDFDNSPHVPVLLPIGNQLRQRGYSIYSTARDVAQTVDLLQQAGEHFKIIDQAFPKGKAKKLCYTVKRAFILSRYLRKIKPVCAVSHTSRSAILGAWLAGIPSVAMYDYEYVDSFFQNHFATLVLMPQAIDEQSLRRAKIRLSNLEQYPGLKEQIYLSDFQPSKGFLDKIGIDPYHIIIVLRPPGTAGHYHNPESELLMDAVFKHLSTVKTRIFLIVLPRNRKQAEELRKSLSTQGFSFLAPDRALPGPELIYYSDTVITGGGTMIREAAVLGTPAYSIFKGPKGAVDQYLEFLGRLTFIDKPSDVNRIRIRKNAHLKGVLEGGGLRTVSFICDKIEMLINSGKR